MPTGHKIPAIENLGVARVSPSSTTIRHHQTKRCTGPRLHRPNRQLPNNPLQHPPLPPPPNPPTSPKPHPKHIPLPRLQHTKPHIHSPNSKPPHPPLRPGTPMRPEETHIPNLARQPRNTGPPLPSVDSMAPTFCAVPGF